MDEWVEEWARYQKEQNELKFKIQKKKWIMKRLKSTILLLMILACYFLAVYAGCYLAFHAGREKGISQTQKAVADKIREIRADQEKGFMEKADKAIQRLERGGN